MDVLFLVRLRHGVRPIEEEDSYLLAWLLCDIYCTVNAFRGLFPFHLPGRELDALLFSVVAILDQENVAA
jgi:hypothetical protein